METKNIWVINGPNLNILGERQPHLYGDKTLPEIVEYTETKLKSFACVLNWFQSNSEGEIIDILHRARVEQCDLLVINPAGYTHSSVAIYDALLLLEAYKIEVHLTNTNSREDFRKLKITTAAVDSAMEGFGYDSYYLAVSYFLNKGEEDDSNNST